MLGIGVAACVLTLLALSGLLMGNASSDGELRGLVGTLVVFVLVAVVGLRRAGDLHARELEASARRHTVAMQISRRAVGGDELSVVLDEAAGLVAMALGVECCAIFGHSADSGDPILRACQTWRTGNAPASPGELDPFSATSPHPRARDVETGPSVMIGTPQCPWGRLCAYSVRRRAFKNEELLFLETIASVLDAAIQRRLAVAAATAREAELVQRAFHDALTGLPNRALFDDRLRHAAARAQREGACMSVLFVDLDGFKGINDTFGHAAGDLLLKDVADRMRCCLRDGDTPARLGGDEFAILLEATSETEARQVIARLHDALSPPAIVQGQAVHISASIGLASTSEAPGPAEVEQLLHQADVAMYREKQARSAPPRDPSRKRRPDSGCAARHADSRRD